MRESLNYNLIELNNSLQKIDNLASKIDNAIVDENNGKLVKKGNVSNVVTALQSVNQGDVLLTNYYSQKLDPTQKMRYFKYSSDKNYIGFEDIEIDCFVIPEGTYFIRGRIKVETLLDMNLNGDFRIIKNPVNTVLANTDDIGRCDKNVALLKEQVNEILYESSTTIKVYDFFDANKTHSQIISEALQFSKYLLNRVLVFDTITWNIDEAILIPSNTVIIIDGITIKQKDFTFDNVFRGDNLEIDPENPNGLPLSVSLLENVKILGINDAQVIGPDENFKIYNPGLKETQEAVGDYYGFRTLQVSFSNANNIEVSGLNFSKTRCWCISLDKCSNFKIHDIEINSNVKNGDGIDIRHGSNNGFIYNIKGDTSDDLVALTSMPIVLNYPAGKNQQILFPIEPASALLKGATPEVLGIHDVQIKNIKKSGAYHAVIVCANGGNVNKRVLIDNVQETKPQTRDALVKIYKGYAKGYVDNDISEISVNNVAGIGTYTGAVVYCNCKIGNSWINKVSVDGDDNKTVVLDSPDGITLTNS
ncbi:glycosyl hydrolase family 28 protein [Wenyingzhuangia sp. IMCC45533]